MKKTFIEHKAADSKAGMTIEELRNFIIEAMKVNLDPVEDRVRVRLTWRGTIKSVRITVEHDEN